MSVFITGIAGFLGSHLADAFLANGYEVKGNDTLQTGDRSLVPDGATFYEVDCNNLAAMREAMDGADIVYHTAALPYEGLSVFAPAQISQSVFQATSSTLSAAAESGVERFIYCSSMSRYGDNDVPFHEEMEPDPPDPYAINKVAAEQLVRQISNIHGFEFSIAVPHNIVGPRQKYDDPFRNVVAIFINRMLQGNQPIIYGDGEQRRCFTYIDDAINPLYEMAFNDAVTGEIINIGPDDEFVTINTLAQMVADELDFLLEPIYTDARPQEVKLAYCSADKARDLLDYKSDHTLREGVKNTIDWIKESGPKDFEYHLDLEIETEQTPATWSNELI